MCTFCSQEQCRPCPCSLGLVMSCRLNSAEREDQKKEQEENVMGEFGRKERNKTHNEGRRRRRKRREQERSLVGFTVKLIAVRMLGQRYSPLSMDSMLGGYWVLSSRASRESLRLGVGNGEDRLITP